MSSPAPADLNSINFPVYGLQGGGLGRFEGTTLVFHELPDWCPADGFDPKVGDPVPTEWDYQPANLSAREQCLDEEYAETSPDRLDVLYYRADDKLLCACGVYADGKVNHRGDAACADWPACVSD